jgi:hypothetical protein
MGGLGLSTPSAPDPIPSLTAAARAETTAVLHRGASWLFWIAGLSVINAVILLAGSSWMFLGGLGVTYVAALVALQLGSTQVAFVAAFATIWATGFFAVLGYFARKGQQWAFITGMALYAVDLLLVLYVQAWLMVLFHGYILFRLYQGYASCKALHAFNKAYTGSGMPLQQ